MMDAEWARLQIAIISGLQSLGPEKRKVLFEAFHDVVGYFYCLDCGFEQYHGRICHCTNDE